MQEVDREISKEEYDRYNKMSYKDFQDEIQETIPVQWFCGYGWYGCRLTTNGDKYYVTHRLGSSCD